MWKFYRIGRRKTNLLLYYFIASLGKAKGKHDTNHGEKQGSYKSKVNTINSAVLYSKLLYLIKHWWLWII